MLYGNHPNRRMSHHNNDHAREKQQSSRNVTFASTLGWLRKCFSQCCFAPKSVVVATTSGPWCLLRVHRTSQFSLQTRRRIEDVMARVSMPVLAVAFFCDILAFGLALGAMAKRSKAAPTYSAPGYLTCGYTKDSATGLAATAFVFLFFGQVLITAVTSCFCLGNANYNRGSGRIVAGFALVISWIMFAIAEIFLLTGAIVNNIKSTGQVDEGVTSQSEVDCAHVKKVFFAVGAAFTFITMLTSLGYYFLQAGAESKEQQWSSYRGDAESDADPYTAHDGPHVGMTPYH